MRAMAWCRSRRANERNTIEAGLVAAWSLEMTGAYPEVDQTTGLNGRRGRSTQFGSTRPTDNASHETASFGGGIERSHAVQPSWMELSLCPTQKPAPAPSGIAKRVCRHISHEECP